MMALIFAFLVLAFLLAWFRHGALAKLAVAVSIGCAIGLFLWEIYSPEYGFAMPWLQF